MLGSFHVVLFHFLIWLLLPEPCCVLFHGYCYFGSVKSFLKWGSVDRHRAHTQELQQLPWRTRRTELIQSSLLSRRHLSWFQGGYDRVGWDLYTCLWGHLSDFLNRQVKTPCGRKVLCQLEALSLEGEGTLVLDISVAISQRGLGKRSQTSAWAGTGFPDLKIAHQLSP